VEGEGVWWELVLGRVFAMGGRIYIRFEDELEEKEQLNGSPWKIVTRDEWNISVKLGVGRCGEGKGRDVTLVEEMAEEDEGREERTKKQVSGWIYVWEGRMNVRMMISGRMIWYFLFSFLYLQQ
jgi:hypothetical protein